MKIRTRIQLLNDERGFALVLAISLITLVTMTAVSIMTLTQGEDTNSRRDQAKDGAYQAAEAGTNAYLSNLTENPSFFNGYVAKGEATRTDSGNVAHANDCVTGTTNPTNPPPTSTCSNLAWTSGATWTYKTAAASDMGWFSMGSGYDYLIKVYPANTALTGLAGVITRIDVTGRPHGSSDVTKWHTIETMIRPSSLSDFQAFLGSSITYGSAATTTGPIFAGEDASGNRASITHQGIAKANLYAEGNVNDHGPTTYQNGARKYDQNTTPTALCKLNNCTPVPFSTFASTLSVVQGAAAGSGGISLGSTDSWSGLASGQVDAWKLTFLSTGKVTAQPCRKYYTTGTGAKIWELYDGSNQPLCGPVTSPQTYNVPAVGAIYSATDVIVSGVVKGKVTVATPGNIIYGGSVTYVTGGTDVIGLEAGDTIYIAQWAPDTNFNLTIYGAQLALGGPWTANPNCGSPSGCHSFCNTSGSPDLTKCIMTFYGSSAVYGQSSSAISMAGMFNVRNYNYDNNLIYQPPPWWPSLGNAFTILVQREL